MRFPRPQAVCIASLFCLAACFPSAASGAVETNSAAIVPTPNSANDDASSGAVGTSIEIPGPLRSFLRMAGISQEVTPDEVLPMLARNVALYGFSSGHEKEYLILVDRYVHLARDLRNLANANGTIRIAGCRDAGNLIQVLGYRLTQECGRRTTSLMTANPERAFLTIDSGFPLTALEQAMQKDGPFTYSFPGTRVPVLLNEAEWVSASNLRQKQSGGLLDLMLHDQDLDRLYAAMAKWDEETRLSLSQSPGLHMLMPVSAVVDLYGGEINVKAGRVVVPGDTDKGWEELVGVSPQKPGAFVNALLTKDGGWLAAYFDALSRLNRSEQVHITEGPRLKRFYDVYRSTTNRADASRGVYPRNGELLVLLASLRWTPDGDLAIPGDLNVWNDMLTEMGKSRELRPWLRRGHEWNTSGKLLETMVAASNYRGESGPVQVYQLLTAIDAGRPQERQMSPEAEKLIAHRYNQFNRWFPLFAEFPALDDAAITKFVAAADRIDGISNAALRANALGAFQADVGLWNILARQGQIPADQLNSSWHDVVQPFITVSSSVQLFEAARTGLQASLQAAAGNKNLSQDQIIDLLAGPVREDRDSQRVHQEIADRIRAVLDDQRLASLDTLFGLYDGMSSLGHGSESASSLMPLAENLHEFEMPRPIFTGNERSSWAPAVYTSRHAELQVRTDLARILKSPAAPTQVESARGELTPFLRDTLVGLNYAYYEPPGSEVLHNNPLFVRSHDFSSISVQGVQEIWGVPRLVGVGATAGGGAYLLGSLADLPYALAMTESDFIVPRNVQALIWKEVVPDLLVDSTLPRWWNVSKNELHVAALYQRAGEEILGAAARNQELHAQVTEILSERMPPVRLERLERALEKNRDPAEVVALMLPADLLYLEAEYRKRNPGEAPKLGQASLELDELCQKYPADANWDRLSADFGVPHPVFTQTSTSILLKMKTLATFSGNSGRIFAESWDSNNLYWARLADEMGYAPVELNLLAPELTRSMVANIFASNIDDWPALLRAMELTGKEFKQGKIMRQVATAATPQATNGNQ